MYEKRGQLDFFIQALSNIESIDKKIQMVTVKYNAECDDISMSGISNGDDLIERNFHNRFWCCLKRRKFQGIILMK